MKNRPSLVAIEAFNKRRGQELEQKPAELEEGLKATGTNGPNKAELEIINMIKVQRSEIERISHELAGVTEQLNAQQRQLDNQDKEIAALKQKLAGYLDENERAEKARKADQIHNKQLILKNIVQLIEEEGFSHNDVARLFKLEGFLPPSPYASWDEKVVEQLYAATR